MDIVSKINGNTCSATEFNQIPTELEALQTSSGQTSSDAILNQVSIATSRYAANNFYIDSGTADAYILTLAASMTNPVSATVGYFTGMTIRFRAGNANTGASTVNVNSAGVKNLKQADGTTDLAAGDIPTTQDSIFRYNGTAFVLQIGAASETAKGIAELATQSEANTGTDDTRIITPLKLKNAVTAQIRFGSYSAVINNTTYLAAYDGFVIMTDNSTDPNGIIYSDASNPPTTIISKYAIDSLSGGFGTASAPIKKGNYYKVSTSGTLSYGFFIPILNN